MLNYIRKGIQARDFFLYHDKTITIRPLTTIELDEAQDKAFGEIDDMRLVKTVMDIKLGRRELMSQMPQNPEFYLKIRKFWNTVDYWIVYHGMKDFMPSDFTIDDVKSMDMVHDIAQRILSMSSKPRDAIIEVLKTPEGKELAEIIYYYKVPLTDAAWKLTPLQKDFMYWAGDKSPKVVAKSWEEALEYVRK